MSIEDFEDAILRFDHRLDGLANGTAAALGEDIDGTLAAIERELRRDAADDDPMTRARLQAVQRRLVDLRADLEDRMADRVDEALEAVADTTPAAVAGAIVALGSANILKRALGRLLGEAAVAEQASLDALEEAIDAAADLADLANESFDRRSWRQWGRKLAADTTARAGAELSQSLAAGETVDEAARRLGTVGNLARNSAASLAHGAIQDIGQRAQAASFEAALGPAIVGWRFTATLDGRTSEICRALDGSVFKAGDPNIPQPPRHRRCRSVLVPVTNLTARAQGDRPFVRATVAVKDLYPTYRRLAKERIGLAEWKRLSPAAKTSEIKASREAWQKQNIGQVRASVTYEKWLARQPDSFQHEVLGPTRLRAWKNGVPLSAMATHDRALTVKELRAMYPRQTGGTP